eukprot:TRINITY_DN4945_c4_g1_i2.p1 TRINITY_DN4945_c4_g1~~TRINITY_DN4945_c4_g1_i2.p1  ORF type:complete len:959 (+),score=192.31 TRINITY_DN4945_c4_g1_i2:65-2878(+)
MPRTPRAPVLPQRDSPSRKLGCGHAVEARAGASSPWAGTLPPPPAAMTCGTGAAAGGRMGCARITGGFFFGRTPTVAYGPPRLPYGDVLSDPAVVNVVGGLRRSATLAVVRPSEPAPQPTLRRSNSRPSGAVPSPARCSSPLLSRSGAPRSSAGVATAVSLPLPSSGTPRRASDSPRLGARPDLGSDGLQLAGRLRRRATLTPRPSPRLCTCCGLLTCYRDATTPRLCRMKRTESSRAPATDTTPASTPPTAASSPAPQQPVPSLPAAASPGAARARAEPQPRPRGPPSSEPGRAPPAARARPQPPPGPEVPSHTAPSPTAPTASPPRPSAEAAPEAASPLRQAGAAAAPPAAPSAAASPPAEVAAPPRAQPPAGPAAPAGVASPLGTRRAAAAAAAATTAAHPPPAAQPAAAERGAAEDPPPAAPAAVPAPASGAAAAPGRPSTPRRTAGAQQRARSHASRHPARASVTSPAHRRSSVGASARAPPAPPALLPGLGPPPHTFLLSRSKFAEELLEEAGWERYDERTARHPPSFSRMCRFAKSAPALSAWVRPFPYPALAQVCDKRALCEALVDRAKGEDKSGLPGLRHRAPWPETYTSLEDWQRAMRRRRATAPAAPVTAPRGALADLWYVKTGGGWSGQGVHVFKDRESLERHVAGVRLEAPNAGTGRGYVIQRGISDLQLLGGRKVVYRSHVLFCGPKLRMYLHRDGVLIQHGEDYDKDSTSREVQVLHGSIAWHDRYLSRRAECRYDVLQPQARKVCQELYEIMVPLLRAAQAEAQPPGCAMYALLGVDFLLDTAGRVWCLEVNESPSLSFPEDQARQVCEATMRDLLSLHVFPAVCGAEPDPGGWEQVLPALPPAPRQQQPTAAADAKPADAEPPAAPWPPPPATSARASPVASRKRRASASPAGGSPAPRSALQPKSFSFAAAEAATHTRS